jgi:hypothetical protein
VLRKEEGCVIQILLGPSKKLGTFQLWSHMMLRCATTFVTFEDLFISVLSDSGQHNLMQLSQKDSR